LKSIPLEERNLTDFSEIHDLQKIVKRADKNLNSKKNAAACLADLEEKFKKLDAERIKLEKEIAAIQANNRSLRLEKTLLRNIVAQHPMFGMDQQNPTLFSHSQPGVLTEAEVTSHYRLPNPGGSHDKG